MNGEYIQIRAVIVDEAGNWSYWINETNFQNPTNSPYIKIEGTKKDHRPLITSVTSDKTDGWWGDESDDNTISIQISAQNKNDSGIPIDPIVPITVTGGTPSIQLEIGPENGIATYTSGSGQNELVFQYTIGENHTSIGNLPDGDLQFKLIPNNAGEAIIDLNTAEMYSAAGNLLLTGVDNPTSPLLPTPGETGSLSKNKDLYIDGVDPYEVYVVGSEFDQKAMTIGGIITKGTEQRPGYYNYRTSEISFTIYFRNTTDLITITQLGNEDAEVDLSLALTPDPACNRDLVECGSIQLKVGVADLGETPTNYSDLAPAIPINYSAVVDKGTGLINDDGGSEDDAHQIISYNASPTTAIVETGDFEALTGVLDLSNDFVEGVELSFKAVITDLAGNQTTTEIYGTIITVDQTPPADGSATPNDPNDDMITGSVVTNAPFPEFNVMSGFWNSHNTGLKLTAPLPAGDPSLIGGAVLILGKKSGNDTYDQLGYTITTVDGATGEHSSNDLYDCLLYTSDAADE